MVHPGKLKFLLYVVHDVIGGQNGKEHKKSSTNVNGQSDSDSEENSNESQNESENSKEEEEESKSKGNEDSSIYSKKSKNSSENK